MYLMVLGVIIYLVICMFVIFLFCLVVGFLLCVMVLVYSVYYGVFNGL